MKNPRYGLLAVACVLFVAAASNGRAQGEFRSPTNDIGARAASLAGAFIAEPYDLLSMYWNPGALAYLPRPAVMASHGTDVTSGVVSDDIAAGFRLTHKDLVALGFSVDHRGYVNDKIGGVHQFIQYGYDLAYAIEVVPTLSIGGRLGVQYGSSESTNLWAASASFGLCYFPSQEISYGASVDGLGSEVRYEFDGYSVHPQRTNAPRSLQVGAMVRFPSDMKEPVVALAIANQKIFGTNGLVYNGGIELFPVQYLVFRLGYRYANQIGISSAKYGLGLHVGRFHLDYGVSPGSSEDQTYGVSVSMDLWGPRAGVRR